MGNVLWECPSIGYPIPNDQKLVAPEDIVYDKGEYGGGNLTIENPEPNGLWRSNNTVGTWVMCTLEDGTVYAKYTEQHVDTWPFPVERDANGQYQQVKGSQPSKTLDLTRPTPEPTAAPTWTAAP
jgi:hypothetical protein